MATKKRATKKLHRTVELPDNDEAFTRTSRAYARRCEHAGHLFQHPSYGASGYVSIDGQEHYELNNSRGRLALYAVTRSGFRWVEHEPVVPLDEVGLTPREHALVEATMDATIRRVLAKLPADVLQRLGEKPARTRPQLRLV